MRLTDFLQGDIDTLHDQWISDRDKDLRKERKPRPDTKERRVQQGSKLIIRGFERHGPRLVEANGKVLAEAVFGQIINKHDEE